MKLNITKVLKKDFLGLAEYIGPVQKRWVDKSNFKMSEEEAIKRLGIDQSSIAAVVSMDLLKYSRKSVFKQVTIPSLLEDLHTSTLEILSHNEEFLFSGFLKEDIPRIDTGDGAFTIFSTPLHGLLYILWFNIVLGLYNTYHVSPELRHLLGSLKMRFSMSYDRLFQFENNYYGPAIINAGRIISKDKLDRFLVEENVINWFIEYLNGLENIQSIAEIELIQIFKEVFDFEVLERKYLGLSLFHLEKEMHWGIRSCDLQEIGELPTKDRNLNVFSIHLQVLAGLIPSLPEHEDVKLTQTIGNLNPLGLD